MPVTLAIAIGQKGTAFEYALITCRVIGFEAVGYFRSGNTVKKDNSSIIKIYDYFYDHSCNILVTTNDTIRPISVPRILLLCIF